MSLGGIGVTPPNHPAGRAETPAPTDWVICLALVPRCAAVNGYCLVSGALLSGAASFSLVSELELSPAPFGEGVFNDFSAMS